MSIDYYKLMGWTLVLVAAIFALGLVKPFAPHFYPGSPSLLRRFAAPLIFIVLAAACLLGVGREALSYTVLIGLTLITFSRWRRRSDKHAD